MNFIAIFLLCALPSAFSFSFGAPNLACTSLSPDHSGNSPQTGPPPFNITLSTHDVMPEDPMSILITSSIPFKGFLIQSRDTWPTSPIFGLGTFMNSATVQTINCHGGVMNSATHSSNQLRTSQTIVWTAGHPDDFIGVMSFHVTIVTEYSTFWVGVRSHNVNVGY